MCLVLHESDMNKKVKPNEKLMMTIVVDHVLNADSQLYVSRYPFK